MSVYYSSSGSSGGNPSIPEVTADPVSPTAGDVWVLHTTLPAVIGTPLGLLLSITRSTDATEMYQLSYYTTENTTVRTVLN